MKKPRRMADKRRGFEAAPVFLTTDTEYHWIAAPDTCGRYALYRVYRWDLLPPEVVRSGIDLKTARKLAEAPAT